VANLLKRLVRIDHAVTNKVLLSAGLLIHVSELSNAPRDACLMRKSRAGTTRP